MKRTARASVHERMSNDEGEPKRPSKPPIGRFGRLARLGALAPRAASLAMEGVRKRLAGDDQTQDQKDAQRERVLKEAKKTAEQMLKTLGEMKGLPLKLGQMASYIDGIAPPGYEEKFQHVLKKLQAKAPPLSPEAAEKVIKAELGGMPLEIFAEFERGMIQERVNSGLARARAQGKRNNLQLRMDVLNFGNLLNNKWGTGQRLVSNQPLISRGANGAGEAIYRLQNVGNELLSTTFQKTAGIGDVYRIQLGLRYTFD